MATLDCYDIHRGVCHCGDGQFVVEECEPDHPFARASQREWRATIECAKCNSTYALVEQDNDFAVVRQSDIREREREGEGYRKKSAQFMARSDVRAYLDRLVKLLSAQKSVAAVHRLLSDAGFFLQSVSTFRKHYSDAESCVQHHVRSPRDVRSTLKALGTTDKELEAEIDALNRLSSKAFGPCEPVARLGLTLRKPLG